MSEKIIDANSDFEHDEKAQQFIREMKPENAFVNYKWLNKDPKHSIMLLTHIEVPQSARGTGLGARFAIQVLNHLEQTELEIHISCSFMRKVAGKKPNWRIRFNIDD